MVIVVEKPRIICKHNCLVACFSQVGPRLIELGLLDMTAMDLIELPVVTVCVNYSRVLYLRIDIVHVLQAPEPSTHGLRQGERLAHELGVDGAALHWEEEREEREADALLICGTFLSLELFSEVVLLEITKTLVHERIDSAVELAEWACTCLKCK